MFPLNRFETKQFNFQLSQWTEPKTRFVVVIGPNGAGKSRLLGEMADAAAFVDRPFHQQQRVADGPTLAVSNLISDPFTRSRVKGRDFRYLGVRTRAGNSTSTGSLLSITIDAVLSCMRDAWRIQAVREAMAVAGIQGFQLRTKSRPKQKDDDFSGPLNRLEPPTARLLVAKLRELGEEFHRRDDDVIDWVQFLIRSKQLTGVHEFTEEESLAITWKYALPRPALIVNSSGRLDDIKELSVGQLLLISMIARVAAFVEHGALVLIDEPEVGLHPTWQSDVIPLLRQAIPEDYEAQVFIATHSPHLVADADDVLVPGEHWGAFVEYPDDVSARSVESILYRVFNARVTGNQAVQTDLAVLSKYVAGTDRAEPEVADEAARRLKNLVSDDTPVASSLLASFRNVRESELP